MNLCRSNHLCRRIGNGVAAELPPHATLFPTAPPRSLGRTRRSWQDPAGNREWSVTLAINDLFISSLQTLLGESLQLRHHPRGFWRVDPACEPARSPNAGFWLARGRGGWFATSEEAVVHLAHAFGCYRDPPQPDNAIENAVLDLVRRHPGRYSARELRGLANRHTGPIACAAARCDAAVKRLIKRGLLSLRGADGRCAGRLVACKAVAQ